MNDKKFKREMSLQHEMHLGRTITEVIPVWKKSDATHSRTKATAYVHNSEIWPVFNTTITLSHTSLALILPFKTVRIKHDSALLRDID